ncbi:YcaO-like family protein [Gleimia europaea]|uniref:SagD family bacteriocin biosynthesis docking scaffold n=1 Tax=Gleimia europaea ACS-120-V-Col10b TaxID=883069 RepID=A0A9W5RCT3_9ACTO|nr:YcaO-like family protein [Gleimia europaea]EPD29322.1 SagD family bacteriocin biosynthesis docking scaffold [Gleimia europaea ACS-120-V-Col10b]
MFAESARGLFEIPGGFLVSSDDARSSLGDLELRQRWLRTRSRHILQIAAKSSARHVFQGPPIFPGIREGMRRACDHLSREEQNRYAVWEFHAELGQIRRGIPTLGKDWEEGRAAQSADLPNQTGHNADTLLDEAGENGVSPGAAKAGLRATALSDMRLPQQVVANRVASYLGCPPNLEVGWTTSSPATGKTPNWNGKEVRSLLWSGHLNSLELSETAALLEGVERRVGALESEPRSVTAKGEELSGRVLTPEDFPPYPDGFYGVLGAPYDSTQPHEWVRVTRLHDGSEAWLAREYVYYGQQVEHQLWALGSSSGCATGSTIAEAELFGLLELIERDSFVGCWYAGINAAPVSIENIRSLDALRARAALLGIELKCGLLPSIIGIPVVVATAQVEDEVGVILAFGAACQPDLESAVNGALNEVWTYINERAKSAREHRDKIERLHADPTLCAGIEDHPLFAMYPSHSAYLEFVDTDQSFLAKIDPSWQAWSKRSASQLLEHVVGLLDAEGVDVWAHRQTSRFEQSLGLETVMMVAPNLLPLDFGWKQQRALQSERLRKIIGKYHGPNAKPRRLPHPFS